MRQETGKVGLGPVFRPFMNSDQNIFQILLFQINAPTLLRQNRVTKKCPKYLFDLSSDFIVSALNTDKYIRQEQAMYTIVKF